MEEQPEHENREAGVAEGFSGFVEEPLCGGGLMRRVGDGGFRSRCFRGYGVEGEGFFVGEAMDGEHVGDGGEGGEGEEDGGGFQKGCGGQSAAGEEFERASGGFAAEAPEGEGEEDEERGGEALGAGEVGEAGEEARGGELEGARTVEGPVAEGDGAHGQEHGAGEEDEGQGIGVGFSAVDAGAFGEGPHKAGGEGGPEAGAELAGEGEDQGCDEGAAEDSEGLGGMDPGEAVGGFCGGGVE